MASSAFYKGKIDEFVSLKGQLNSQFSNVDTCSTMLTKSKKYLGGIVICGEPIDKGMLNGKVSTIISNINDTINTLLAECDTKIEEYTSLYNAALKEEERAAKRSKGWFPWI